MWRRLRPFPACFFKNQRRNRLYKVYKPLLTLTVTKLVISIVTWHRGYSKILRSAELKDVGLSLSGDQNFYVHSFSNFSNL